jgi:hypothetical protein
MTDGIWSLQDSPIFWFVASSTPTPGPPITGATTYTLNAFNDEDLGAKKLPEVAQRIWVGDQRYMQEE